MLSLRKTSPERGRKGSKFKLFGDCLVLKVIFWEERVDAVGERCREHNKLLLDRHQPRPSFLMSVLQLYISAALWV